MASRMRSSPGRMDVNRPPLGEPYQLQHRLTSSASCSRCPRMCRRIPRIGARHRRGLGVHDLGEAEIESAPCAAHDDHAQEGAVLRVSESSLGRRGCGQRFNRRTSCGPLVQTTLFSASGPIPFHRHLRIVHRCVSRGGERASMPRRRRQSGLRPLRGSLAAPPPSKAAPAGPARPTPAWHGALAAMVLPAFGPGPAFLAGSALRRGLILAIPGGGAFCSAPRGPGAGLLVALGRGGRIAGALTRRHRPLAPVDWRRWLRRRAFGSSRSSPGGALALMAGAARPGRARRRHARRAPPGPPTVYPPIAAHQGWPGLRLTWRAQWAPRPASRAGRRGKRTAARDQPNSSFAERPRPSSPRTAASRRPRGTECGLEPPRPGDARNP